jgi:hypothetical protein
MSLADLTGTVDSGAGLSLYSPDIPIDVASPSFDPSINYLQSDVPGVPGTFDPNGQVQTIQAVDATQATILNGMSMPTSTEDSVAYAATGQNPIGNVTNAPGGTTHYFDPSGTGIKNAVSQTGAQDTTAVVPGAGTINAPMHGIADALTGLIRIGTAVDTLANVKNNTQTQGTPMGNVPAANHQPLRAPIFTPPNATQATVPGPFGKGGSMSPLILVAIAVGGYFLLRHA